MSQDQASVAVDPPSGASDDTVLIIIHIDHIDDILYYCIYMRSLLVFVTCSCTTYAEKNR